MYKTVTKIAKRYFTDAQIYKYGFNWSPMYRRTTGRVIEVSEDGYYVKIKIPLSLKNKNYMGSIFGGSLFSATDPIYMIQLINILKDDYVVWEKPHHTIQASRKRNRVYRIYFYPNRYRAY